MPHQENPAQTEPDPTRRPPRRWGRRLSYLAGLGILLLIIVLLALPTVISRHGKNWLVSLLNTDVIDGTAEIGALRFSWPAHLEVDDVRLNDADGKTVITAQKVFADADLWLALRGRFRGTLRAEGATLFLRQDPRGRLTVATLFRSHDDTRGTPPDLKARIELIDGRLAVSRLRFDDGRTFGPVEGELTFEGQLDLERPQPVTLDRIRLDSPLVGLNGRGELGRGGTLHFEGSAPTAAVTTQLADFLRGHRLSGKPLNLIGTWSLPDALTLRIAQSRLEVVLPRSSSVVLNPLELLFVTRPGNLSADLRLRTQLDGRAVALAGRKLRLETATRLLTLNDLELSVDGLGGVLNGTISLGDEPTARGLSGKLLHQSPGRTPLPIEFALDGPLAAGGVVRLLRKLRGTAETRPDKLTYQGFTISGLASARLLDGQLRAANRLTINGGTAEVKLNLDLRDTADARSSLGVRLTNIRAATRMTGFLSTLHPLFFVKSEAQSISGTIDLTMQCTYAQKVTDELLEKGWSGMPKRPLRGTGELRIPGITLKGSPLLRTVLGLMSVSLNPELSLASMRFEISNGRIHYRDRVEVKLGKLPTYWSGSVGLDGSLDLVLEIPLTPGVLKKYPYLKYVPNLALKIPVSGTSSTPKLAIEQVLGKLADTAVAPLKDVTDLLSNLLGIGEEAKAKRLLTQADAAFRAGQRREAKRLYGLLHQNYRGTQIYQNNSLRIDHRRHQR